MFYNIQIILFYFAIFKFPQDTNILFFVPWTIVFIWYYCTVVNTAISGTDTSLVFGLCPNMDPHEYCLDTNIVTILFCLRLVVILKQYCNISIKLNSVA
jgi:hypothetical protein